MAIYTHKPWAVDAEQWTGKNFNVMKNFILKNFSKDADPQVNEFRKGNILSFMAFGEIYELEVGDFAVCFAKNEGTAMTKTEFLRTYDEEIKNG